MEELVLEWEEVQMRDREPGKQNKRPWNKDRKLCLVKKTETLGEMEKRQISAAPELRGLRSLALLPITEKSSSAGIQCCWATTERKVSSKSKERRGLGDEWGSNVKKGTEDDTVLIQWKKRCVRTCCRIVGYVLTFLEKNSSEFRVIYRVHSLLWF